MMAGSIALACAANGAEVAWIAPIYKNSRPLWRFAERMVAPVASKLRVNKSEREIEFPSGGNLNIFSADSPDSIRGRAFDLVILDEAARIAEEVWEDAIQPTLADRAGRALLISTPKGHNWFWREFIAARADGKDRAAFTAPSSANPNPNIRAAFAKARERVPDRTYRQEWLAEFVEDGGDVFRGVRECADAIIQDHPVEGHSYVFGVDWARSNDYTVIQVIDVNLASQVYMDRFSDVNYSAQVSRLSALYERFHPQVIYSESNSMGGPLTEHLQELGLPVSKFDTTARTKPLLIDALSLAFERRALHIIPDEILIAELQAYEQTTTAAGVRYSAPEGIHDDCVMSLALAYYAMDHSHVQVWI